MSEKSKKGRTRVPASKPAENKPPFPRDQELYKQGVLSRGEAAKRGKDGKLPPGVTHEIIGDDIVRVRYSLL